MYFLAELGLRSCLGFSLVTGSGANSLAVACGLLVAVASLGATLWGTRASAVSAPRL